MPNIPIFQLTAGLGIGWTPRSSDVTANAGDTIRGEHAYAQAATNVTGGNVSVTPGCGRRFLTVANFGSIAAGATVTVTVNGVATVLTGGGTNWNSITSNNATATSIAAAINSSAASPGVTATAVAAVVYVQVNAEYNATLATSDGTNLAVTSGTDGYFVVQNTDNNVGHQVQIYHDGTNVNIINPITTVGGNSGTVVIGASEFVYRVGVLSSAVDVH